MKMNEIKLNMDKLSVGKPKNSNDDTESNSELIISEVNEQKKFKCKGYTDNRKSTKRLIISLGCCVVFFLIELIFGIISGSLALVSDSFHMLSDATGFIISLVAILFSSRHATKAHTFGFHRAEILGVLISVFLIWIITAFLFVEAVDRLRNPVEINGKVMLITAIFGIIMNIVLFFTLGHDHGGEGGHSHGHSHGHDLSPAEEIDLAELGLANETSEESSSSQKKKDKKLADNIKNYDKDMNINVKSAFIHVVGDLLSSIGVLIASIIITIDKDLVFFDPICTFIFSVLIIITTLRLLWQAVSVLMESTPSNINLNDVTEDLKSIEGVVEVHDLHIWNLTVGKPSMTVHISINPENSRDTNPLCTFERVLYESQMLICTKYKIHHSTIQIELCKAKKCCDKHSVEFNKFTEHCEPGMCSITSSTSKKGLKKRNKKNKNNNKK